MNSKLTELEKRQAEDGIRDAYQSRGLGDVYKRQIEETKVEEDLNPTPYKNPNRNLMDKAEDETETATEQKDTSAEATPEERTETVEDKVYKKRYDDLKRHYDSTLNKNKDEILKLKKQVEDASKRYVPPKSKEELDAWRKEYPDVYDAVNK